MSAASRMCLSRSRSGALLGTTIIARTSRSLAGPSSRSFTYGRPSRLAEAAAPLPPPKQTLLRRTTGFVALAIICTASGFVIAAAPGLKASSGYLNPPSDKETLSLFKPEDPATREIEEYIQNHPLSKQLRAQPEFVESRPHLKIPPAQRSHNLTGGTLQGPDRVTVPPVSWAEAGGKSLISIVHLGQDLCGHPGLIHGGLIATLLDEGLAKCCIGALPNKVAMTANLNINYRSPARAGGYVVLRAKTTKVEGRKAWVEGRLETLAGEGETPILIAEASALFIEPRQAANMARVYPVG